MFQVLAARKISQHSYVPSFTHEESFHISFLEKTMVETCCVSIFPQRENMGQKLLKFHPKYYTRWNALTCVLRENIAAINVCTV